MEKKIIKKKKPEFLRQEGHKRARLKKCWRKPKGLDSKLRRHFRGHRKHPTIGYRNPLALRGLTEDGFKMVVVSNIKDLDKVLEGCIAVIGSGVGMKKKIEILKESEKRKIKVKNTYDDFIKDAEKLVKERKEIQKARKDSKEKSKESSLKKATKKEDKKSSEEKKKKEDKIKSTGQDIKA